MYKFDICVIGAGSAGLVAATTANRLGAKTLLVENNKIGGDCLHSGCVPSKTFIHSAKVFNALKNSMHIGLPEYHPKLNFNKVMKHVRKTVDSIYQFENKEVFEKMGITVMFGNPEFNSNKEILINNGLVKADYFIICTGSSPLVPKINGFDKIEYLTNENFWELNELPEKILILGAGPIGLELGQSLNRFGSKVFIMIRSNNILKKEDTEISSTMEKILKNEGIVFIKNSNIQDIFQVGSDITIKYKCINKSVEIKVNKVFAAIGRTPNCNSLNLEKANVNYTNKGISVNNMLQTTSQNIYASGDVIGKYLFTHAASYYAEVAVNNILKTDKKDINNSIIPWVTFTEPEASRVGLTEEEAKEKYGEINVLKVDCNLDRFIAENKTKGFFKIILNCDDRIVGAHIIGANSGEYIQNITLAIKNNLSIYSFAETIYPYPTFSEIIKKAFVRYLRTKK